MLKNYLKISLRALKKSGTYSFINIFGLTVGLTVSLYMGLFISYEFSYDDFHSKADRIFRINSEHWLLSDKHTHITQSARPVAAALEEEFPEVENVVFLDPSFSKRLVRTEATQAYQENIYHASEDLFDVFDFPLLRGNEETALAKPHSVVLTKETARKYYGNSNPLGRTLDIIHPWSGNTTEFTVTGILKEIPSNSHVQFEMLISFSSANTSTSWRSLSYNAYALLKNPGDAQKINARFADFIKNKSGDPDIWYTQYLQPLTDIHLNTLGLGIGAQRDLRYVYILAAIGALIFLLASFNYINMATARATTRTREVGVRKVLGGYRSQLITQFLFESLILSSIAIGLSLILLELGIPYFNNILDAEVSLNLVQNPILLFYLFLVLLLTSLVAGSYPAFFLSRFKPAWVLKGQQSSNLGGSQIRKGLVVFQFLISSVLIVGSLIFYEQLSYIQQKKLGFDKEQVMVIPMYEKETRGQYKTLKQAFENIEGVRSVAATSESPGGDLSAHGIKEPGQEEGVLTPVMAVDYETMETLDLEMEKGRWFSREQGTDQTEGFVVNQTAAEEFGWENPIGQPLERNDQKGKIIGVVEDFHFAPLHQPIEPLILYMREDDYRQLNLELASQETQSLIQKAESTWSTILSGIPFEYHFLDDEFDANYQTEFTMGRIILNGTILALLIASIGLFGLVSFATNRRSREFGIRKVLGASTLNITTLISKDYMKLALLGFVTAIPLAYYFSSAWLSQFTYHTEIDFATYLVSAALVFGTAFSIILVKALKTAYANPVDSIRTE